jgi:hypothetical protein
VVATWHAFLLRWQTIVAALVFVILFMPIRRYAMPGNLPFEAEPYRLLIGFATLGWVAALLVDPRVRLRATFMDGPLMAILAVAAASVIANVQRINDLDVASEVSKDVTFLASFVIVVYLVVSVLPTERAVDGVLRCLVAGGAGVAAFSVVELYTGYNVFADLHRVLPFLQPTGEEESITRAGRLRVIGPAQHPIALGALFALLTPLGIYLALTSARRFRWWVATALLLLGSFATASRTAILMLVVIGVVIFALRPQAVLRTWPMVLPLVVVVQLLMPGTIRTLYEGFFPREGLIELEAAGPVGSSRVASFHAAVDEIKKRPLLGGGYGSRIVTGPERNSFIADNDWVSLGMEVGLIGVAAWAWFFLRFIRRAGRAARAETGDRGWLFVALTACALSYAVGMATFDAHTFIQVTLVLFILVGLACSLARATDSSPLLPRADLLPSEEAVGAAGARHERL